jgi:hypothetical protein
MLDLGDWNVGTAIDFKFNTYNASDVLKTLVGGAVSIYKGNDLTEVTTGVALTVDFDGRTGMHHVRITTSADLVFYTAGEDYSAVITAGTVDGVAASNAILANFSIENRNNKANVTQWRGETPELLAAGFVRATPNIGIGSGTVQGGSAVTMTLATTESSLDSIYAGQWVGFRPADNSQPWQYRRCVSYVGSTKVAYVSPPWVGVSPASGDPYDIQPAAGVDVQAWKGDLVNELIDGRMQANVQHNEDKDNMGLSVAERTQIINTLFSAFIENGITFKEAQRFKLAGNAGPTEGPVPGEAGTVNIYDPAGQVIRISATVDAAGYRTSILLNGTDPTP